MTSHTIQDSQEAWAE